MLIKRKLYISIVGEDPIQEVDDTTVTAEKRFLINFTESRKKFYLSLNYNE